MMDIRRHYTPSAHHEQSILADVLSNAQMLIGAH